MNRLLNASKVYRIEINVKGKKGGFTLRNAIEKGQGRTVLLAKHGCIQYLLQVYTMRQGCWGDTLTGFQPTVWRHSYKARTEKKVLNAVTAEANALSTTLRSVENLRVN